MVPFTCARMGDSFHIKVGGGVSIAMQKQISVYKLVIPNTYTHKHKQAQYNEQ
jgi:hypothetical protein